MFHGNYGMFYRCVIQVELPPLRGLLARLRAADTWHEAHADLLSDPPRRAEVCAYPQQQQQHAPPQQQQQHAPPQQQQHAPQQQQQHAPQQQVSALEAAVADAKPLSKVSEVADGASRLADAISVREHALARLHNAFVKPGCARPLLELLRDVGWSDEAWPPSDAENEHCCACCTPDDGPRMGPTEAEVTWVGCDSCDAWFHAPCVRVPAHVAASLENFTCPRCARHNNTPYAFGDAPPPRLRRTRRPPVHLVSEILSEAAPVRAVLVTDEFDAVEELLRRGHARQSVPTPSTERRLTRSRPSPDEGWPCHHVMVRRGHAMHDMHYMVEVFS